jgi:hypothetical protein
MSRATAVITRLDNALNKVNPVSCQIYKRTSTSVGGDQLLGVAGTVTNTDVLIVPPPLYTRLGRNFVGAGSVAEMVDTGSKLEMENDYAVTFSPSSLNAAEATDEKLLIVFKYTNGEENAYRITDFDTVPFQGIDVIIIAYIRSISRSNT